MQHSEDAPWQHPVASHRIQDARHADLRGHCRGKAACDERCGEQAAEQDAASAVHQVERRCACAQVGEVGEDQAGDPGAHGKDHATGEGGQDDRARNGLLRLACLLRQRRHGVESEECESEDRATRCQVRQVGALAEERIEQPNRLRIAGDVSDTRDYEDHDEHDLRADESEVDVRHEVDSDEVQDGNEQHRGHNPDPKRDGRKHSAHVLPNEDVAQDGQQQVVEQQRPAGHEPEVAAERLLRVRICRARDGVLLHHVCVAVRREQHGDRRDDVRAGQVSIGCLGRVSVARENGERKHVRESEDQQGWRPEAALEVHARYGRLECLRQRGILTRVCSDDADQGLSPPV